MSRARQEGGFSLVELLIVCALFAGVLGVVLSQLTFTQNQASKDISYAQAISDATTGLQTMMRELRNAYRINATNGGVNGVGSMIDFYAYLNYNGTDKDVELEYSCAQPSPTKTGDYACERVWAPDGSSLPSFSHCGTSTNSACNVVIDRLDPTLTPNGNVFKFFGASGATDPVYPTYVQASVQVPRAGSVTNSFKHSISLNNGTALPNLQNS